MARPYKQGLDYFSFDVAFFNDRKIKRIISAQGPLSGLILIKLLCNIYSEDGYYILRDEDLAFDIADGIVGVQEGLVNETINKALQVGFFDKQKHDLYKILTSIAIQRRYFSAVYKRKNIKTNPNFLLIDINNIVNDVNNMSETELMTSEVHKLNEIETKVKESKENNYYDTRGGNFLEIMKKEEEKGIKHNYDGLVDALNRIGVSPAQFNEICNISNNGQIGHPVWKLIKTVESSRKTFSNPGAWIVKQLKIAPTLSPSPAAAIQEASKPIDTPNPPIPEHVAKSLGLIGEINN